MHAPVIRRRLRYGVQAAPRSPTGRCSDYLGLVAACVHHEISWKGFGSEHNRWYRQDMLQDANEFINEHEMTLDQTNVTEARNKTQQRKANPSQKLRNE